MINKRCAALVMAAIMAASSAMSAMAEVSIDGNDGYESGTTVDSVTASDEEADAAVSVSDGDSVSVKGDVDASKTEGVGVAADNGKVEVGGDVKAVDNDAIEAENKSEVNVKGNVEGDRGVWADDSKVTIGGNVSSNDNPGIDAMDGANVTVGGNVTSKNNTGVSAIKTIEATDDTPATTVTVKGDVTSDGLYGIDASDGSVVKVDGNVTGTEEGIHADDAQITVGGDVKADGDGIFADDSEIVVGGDVASKNGVGVSVGISNVTIEGNVSGKYGIINDESTITIKGDVTSKGGTTIEIWGSDKTSTIIEGNVKSGVTDSGITINVSYNKNKDSELAIAGKIENGSQNAQLEVGFDENGKVTDLPEIVVGEIEDINKVDVIDYGTGEKLSDAAKKEVIDNIKYIVSTNTEGMNGNGTITITKVGGGALDKDKSGTYTVGKATETITIHVDTKEGYEVAEVKAGKATASLVKNSDGTYSVTIPAGGGVNIEALLKAIETKAVYNYSDDSDDSSSSNGTPSTWSTNGNNWTYTKANGQKAKDEWQQISYNGQLYWYYFGADMNMSTGLFTDAKGHQYYLNPAESALKGTMATGWVEVDGKWMFFNDGSVADLPLGCYVEGMTK